MSPPLPPYQPTQVRQVLQSTAKDMHTAGFDFKSGAGFLRADQALLTIASPRPDLIAPLIVPNGVNPGDEPFTVIVNGTNLTPESEILFRGDPLETNYDPTTGQLTAEIPEFEGTRQYK
jgi:hypothetical protein